jgi:hypothetical protein
MNLAHFSIKKCDTQLELEKLKRDQIIKCKKEPQRERMKKRLQNKREHMCDQDIKRELIQFEEFNQELNEKYPVHKSASYTTHNMDDDDIDEQEVFNRSNFPKNFTINLERNSK